jgi:actin related protein 2/3 complex subunit 5
MKYLYKAMAMPGYADVNSSALLSWHEKVHPIVSSFQRTPV